jgi:hypothetical protein
MAIGPWYHFPMPRRRVYANATERQRAHRSRIAAQGNRDGIRDSNVDLVERVCFIRDTTGIVASENLAAWKCFRDAEQLHTFALQDDLDRVTELLDALIRGDDQPFQTDEFREWRTRRAAQLAIKTY